MKNTFLQSFNDFLKKMLFIMLMGCLFVFNGCGLDEFYELDPPKVLNNTTQYDTEYSNRYFKFTTNEESSNNKSYLDGSSAFKFLGTAIYYKIYNNYNTMNSDISSISTLANSTNYSNAVTKVTGSYKELGTSSGTITPLIEATGDNRIVYIRLMNYQSSPEYSARIEIRDKTDTNVIKTFVPRRVGNKLTFDFGRTEDDKEINLVPTSDDSSEPGDVSYGTFSDDDKKTFYVNMYAIAVGRDTTYSYYYSNILHLGSVPICSTEKDN